MLTLITSALLMCAPLQDTTPAAVPDAKAELLAASAKLAAAENYSFTSVNATERKSDAPEGERGGRMGGPRGAAPPVEATGAWMKGKPMHLKVGDAEIYQQDERFVHQGEDGTWQVFRPARGGMRERPAGAGEGERGGRRGEGETGRGGRREEPTGGGRRAPRATGAGSFGAAGGRMLMAARDITAPHELLKGFDKMVADVQKSEQGNTVVFEGSLTDAGIASLSGPARGARGGRGGARGAGDGRPGMTTTGTYRIEVTEGAIGKIVTVINRSGSVGERSFEFETTRTITLREVGSTSYDVPAEVLEQFDI